MFRCGATLQYDKSLKAVQDVILISALICSSGECTWDTLGSTRTAMWYVRKVPANLTKQILEKYLDGYVTCHSSALSCFGSSFYSVFISFASKDKDKIQGTCPWHPELPITDCNMFRAQIMICAVVVLLLSILVCNPHIKINQGTQLASYRAHHRIAPSRNTRTWSLRDNTRGTHFMLENSKPIISYEPRSALPAWGILSAE